MGTDKPVTGGKFYLSFINEWEQFFGHYNWKNWNWCLVRFMYENDIILGAYEIEIVLCGIGVRIRYSKPIKTKEMLHLEEMMKDIDSGKAATTWKEWKDVKKEMFGDCCPRCYYKLNGSEDENGESKS